MPSRNETPSRDPMASAEADGLDDALETFRNNYIRKESDTVPDLKSHASAFLTATPLWKKPTKITNIEDFEIRYEYAKEIVESVNKSIAGWQMTVTIFSAIMVVPTGQVKQLHRASTAISFARDLQAIKGAIQYCMYSLLLSRLY